ncbi:uncharacterized protein VP01_1185g1 [Puccinia sorghi]|uniref:Uncharacterized protein n=1 Tax=Puccinia sorghi TaxID=27349 RepID=A0A0L6VR03_9BASI|nr:uncharacterized protein VP01_1185g1 [Puccinia sorghi]
MEPTGFEGVTHHWRCGDTWVGRTFKPERCFSGGPQNHIDCGLCVTEPPQKSGTGTVDKGVSLVTVLVCWPAGRKHSCVWNHLEDWSDLNFGICQVVTKKGNKCGKKLKKDKSSSTKNLQNHLIQVHCLSDPKCMKKQKTNHYIIFMWRHEAQNFQVLDSKNLKTVLVYLLADCELPFDFVERKSFRKLFHHCNPHFTCVDPVQRNHQEKDSEEAKLLSRHFPICKKWLTASFQSRQQVLHPSKYFPMAVGLHLGNELLSSQHQLMDWF